MKKHFTLFALSILFTLTAVGQVRRLKIVNTTSCNVMVTLRYTVPSSSPVCTYAGTSSMFNSAAGYTQTYSGLAAPSTPEYVFGMPAPYNRYLVAANIFSSDLTCPVSVITVGESSCGYPALNNLIAKYSQTCTTCGIVHAQWTTDVAGLDATLLLY